MTSSTHHYPVAQLLQSTHLIDHTVTVKGWVRSRRDSKAGISFIALHDGSCFDPIQAVVPSTLDNYTSDVLKLTKDCAVIIEGTLVASQGGGQTVEIQTLLRAVGSGRRRRLVDASRRLGSLLRGRHSLLLPQDTK